MYKSRKGSHIGIMLSFVIFLVFLIFLYTALEPATKTQKDKQPILDNLKTEIIKKLSSEVEITTIYVKDTYSCIELPIGEIPGSNLRIKNRLNNNVDYDKTGNLKINSDDNFFKIYYSEVFDIQALDIGMCQLLSQENYTIGSVKTNKYVFEKNIFNLINQYQADYETLKKEIKLPVGNEFGFSFIFNNKTSISTGEKNLSTSIYAEEILVQYIDVNATIIPGTLNIKVW